MKFASSHNSYYYSVRGAVRVHCELAFPARSHGKGLSDFSL